MTAPGEATARRLGRPRISIPKLRGFTPALLALVAAGGLVLSACSSGHSPSAGARGHTGGATAASGSRSGKANQAQEVDLTVVGMHFVQMATAAQPIVKALQADLAGHKAFTAPYAERLAAALQQFDAAAPKLAVSNGLQPRLESLLAADGNILKDVPRSGLPSSVPDAQGSVLRGALSQWESADSNLATALGATISTR
jgi:hypothetical protein